MIVVFAVQGRVAYSRAAVVSKIACALPGLGATMIAP
jgi:hypothetical protein